MPFEREWRRNLKGRLEPERHRDSEDPWRSRQPDAGARPDEVDLFASYTPERESARELVEPRPAAPAAPASAPAPAAPAPAPAPPRRRPRRLLAVLGVVLALAAAAAGGAVFERGRIEAAEAQFPPDIQVVTRPVPQVPPACQSALDKASEALGAAIEVERALAEHTSVMNKLVQGKIRGAAALRSGMPSLARGSRATVQLDRAVADYRDLNRQCGP